MSTNSIVAGFDVERSVTGPFTGLFQNLGSPLTENPVMIIFDNQSSVAIELSVDGSTVWKTFSDSEALILDLRANHGQPYDFSVPIGTQFSVRGTAGSNSFRMSIIYGK